MCRVRSRLFKVVQRKTNLNEDSHNFEFYFTGKHFSTFLLLKISTKKKIVNQL